MDSDEDVEEVKEPAGSKSQNLEEYAPSAERSNRFQSAISSAFDGVVSQASSSGGGSSNSSSSSGSAKQKTASKKLSKKGDVFTPLEKQVVQLKEQHPDALLMVECGYRMRFFGEDATNAARVLSIHSHKDHNFMVASVPTHRFLVHARRLIAAGYSVGLVRQTETAAIHSKTKSSSKTFDRSCVGLYTAGTDIDDDDPAFADMISISKKREPSEEDGMDEDDNDDQSVASGEGGTDDNDEPLLAVVVDDAASSTSAVVAIQLRASVLSHRVVEGSAQVREQETMDYLDMLQPTEVVTDTNTSSSLWKALLQRCKGVISMEKQKNSGHPTPTVAALTNAFMVRLNRVAAPAKESNATVARTSAKAWSRHEGLAFAALQRYLASLLLTVDLDDLRLTDDNPQPDTPVAPQDRASSSSSSSPKETTGSATDDRRFRLDPVTARDLEVFTADTSLAPAGSPMPSLLQEMNHCRSAFGKRTLKSWLAAPLISASGIQSRQRAVTWLLGILQEGGGAGKSKGATGRAKGGTGGGTTAPAASSSRSQWLGAVERAIGGGSSNVERWLSALKGGKLSPNKLASLLQWASRLRELAPPPAAAASATGTAGDDLCEESSLGSFPAVVVASLQPESLKGASERASRLLEMLSAGAAVDWKAANDGSVMASLGKEMLAPFKELREKRAELAGHEEAMAEHLKSIRRLLHKPALQYRTLNTGGGSSIEHLVEVDAKDVASNSSLVPTDWVQMNSTKAVLRYHPPEVLKTQQKLILTRDETASAARAAWRDFLLQQVAPSLSAALHGAVGGLGVVDCLLSLARLASRPGYTCPQYSEPPCEEDNPLSSSSLAADTISLTQARHPVAERLMELGGEGQFQPNDVTLRCNFRDRSCLVITGPNMGGKSTYVRMVSVLCLMGQIGSYVPAASAQLPVLDNIFTRMGAGDDLAAGRSTFATELFRTNSIIKRATARSLVVLDELGRGTSTNDGVCIAMASLRYFVRRVGCAMFFVTHYAQISDLVGEEQARGTALEGKTSNVHMGYLQGEGKEGEPPNVLFLFQAVEGASEGSYGLNVARLAGLDGDLLKLAEQKSEWMRKKMLGKGAPAQSANGAGEGKGEEPAQKKRKRDANDNEQKEEGGSNAMDTDDGEGSVSVKHDEEEQNLAMEEEKRKLQRLIEESQRKLEQLSDSKDKGKGKDEGWKEHVLAGRIREATVSLGRCPGLTGTVVHGEKRGRTIGFPTANLGVDFSRPDNVIPTDGVYAGWLTVKDQKLRAAISIGINPTFEGERNRQVEAFALRQDSWIDLYDLPATVTFKERLRDTVKYEGANWLDQLLEQMGKDCNRAWELTEE